LAHELAHTRNPVRRPRFLLEGASGLLDDDERQALSTGRAAASGAGIVDSLPVGGGGMGGVSEVATRAARAAIIEATASPMSALGGAMSGLTGAAEGFAGSAEGFAGSAMSSVSSAASAVDGAVAGVADGTTAAVGDAAGALSGMAGAVGGGAAKPLDPDQVVEIVERRLLREIERRGGRWTGVF
jgi:hypothetical protein